MTLPGGNLPGDGMHCIMSESRQAGDRGHASWHPVTSVNPATRSLFIEGISAHNPSLSLLTATLMSDYNIDDILNANDSDEDIDTLSVDLEKLLDDDDDDDDDDLAPGCVPNDVDLHLYSDSDDEIDTKTHPTPDMPPRPSELFDLGSFHADSRAEGPGNNDPELDKLLLEDNDEVSPEDVTAASSHAASSNLHYSSASSNLHFSSAAFPSNPQYNLTSASSNLQSTGASSNYVAHSSPLHTLELAEKRESRRMYTGDKDSVSALQSKLQAGSVLSGGEVGEAGEAGETEKGGISHFKCVCLEMISTQLTRNSQFKQHGPGVATVVKFTVKFIALGTTRGLVLIFDHNQEMRQVIGSSVPTAGRNIYAISALDVSASGDTIFCGYENGEIIVWDLTKGTVIKRISDLHTGRIVKLCLVYGIGEDAAAITGISSEYTIISVDSKGVVNKIKLSKSLFLSITIESECLLDGSAGSILDLSPMVPFSTLTSYPDIVSVDDMSRDGATKPGVMTDCPAYIPRMDQFIALNSSVRSYVIRVYPEVKIVHRWSAPASVAKHKQNTPTSRKSVAIARGPVVPPAAPPAAANTSSTLNIPVPCSVSLDWTWMPSSYYPELKAAANNAKSLTNPSGPLIHPVVVRGWGDMIEILALIPPSISSSYHPTTGTTTHNTSSDVEAIVVGSHVLPNDVVTVKWLSNHTSVVVMTTRDVLVLNVPSFSSERLPVTKEVNDILSQHVTVRNLDSMSSISICVSRERMYMLATDKMYMFYLQSWQEQAEQLLSDGQWLDALALVLERFKNLEGSMTAAQQVKEEGHLRDYIRRYADLAIMRNADYSAGLSSSFMTSMDGVTAGRGKSCSHHFLVASVCIEYCVLVGGSLLKDVLFGDIYTGFTSAQHQSIFIEALESFTVKRQITDLPTKVFSDMVEYCTRSQQYALLERIVCHLDLTDVDMDGLVRCLKKARLHSGFLYVHAYGLNDYSGALQSVFEDMLLATSQSKEAGVSGSGKGYQFPTPQQVDIGYKLILFLKYAADGQVFPRGGKTVVSALCLTQLVELVISKQHPPVPLTRGNTSSGCVTNTMTAAAMTSPQMNFSYPFLFSLSKIDLYALFHTLALAFKTIYGNSDNGNIVKLNNNNLYFTSFGAMFQCVLNFAKYADSQTSAVASSMGSSGGSGGGSSAFNITHQLCFFELFLDLIASANVYFSMEFLCAVIQHCQKYVKHPSNRAQSLVESLITRQMKYLPPTPKVYETLAAELEQNFFFMTALKLCAVSSKYRYRATSESLRTAVVCYIHNNSNRVALATAAGDESAALQIFPYIHEFFEHMDDDSADDTTDGEFSRCCNVLIELIQELAGVDLQSTQMLMVMYLYDYVELMMEKTKKQQKLQFELLSAMVRGVQNKTVPAASIHTNSADKNKTAEGGDEGNDGKGTGDVDKNTANSSSTEEMLLPPTPLNDRHVLVFISQLATFQPKQVLNFLSTHSNYPLDEALRICKQKSIFNATAYLLERAGDSMAALELCLMEITNTLPDFIAKVEQMVTEARQPVTGMASSMSSPHYSKNASFSRSTSLLQLLKNPCPSKVMEVFQHVEEFFEFNEIIQLVTGICARIDSKSSSSYSHWFHVLDQLLKVKHSLNNYMTNTSSGSGGGSGNKPSASVRDTVLRDLSSGDGDAQMARELVGLVVGQALKVFMSQMGGTVPSQDIVRRITQEEILGSRFSEFKDVMTSMVDSYSYEIALYKTCLRITTSDLLLVRAKRMKMKHRGVRCGASSSTTSQLNCDDSLSSELTALSLPSFEPVNHRSTDRNVGGLAHKRNLVAHQGKKEAFTEATNLIDMAARVVISTELPSCAADVDGDNTAADHVECRVPGTLPLEADCVGSYDGY